MSEDGIASHAIGVSLCGDSALLLDALGRALPSPEFRLLGRTDRAERMLQRLAEDPPEVAIIAGPQDGTSLRRWGEALPFHPAVRFLFIAPAGRDLPTLAIAAGAYGFLDATEASSEAIREAVRALARGERQLPAYALAAGLRLSAQARLPALSAREREVLAWLGTGADNLKIAAHLGLTERTVKAHVSNLYRKLPCENRTQLGLYCRRIGLAPPRGA